MTTDCVSFGTPVDAATMHEGEGNDVVLLLFAILAQCRWVPVSVITSSTLRSATYTFPVQLADAVREGVRAIEAVGVWVMELLAFQRVVVALSDHVPTAPLMCAAFRLRSIEVLLSRLAESVLVVVRDAVIGTDADADKNALDAVSDNVLDGDRDDESVSDCTGTLLLFEVVLEVEIDSVPLSTTWETVADAETVIPTTLLDADFAAVQLTALRVALTDVDPVSVGGRDAVAANVNVGLVVDDAVH
jgi:hypothetical protein